MLEVSFETVWTIYSLHLGDKDLCPPILPGHPGQGGVEGGGVKSHGEGGEGELSNKLLS